MEALIRVEREVSSMGKLTNTTCRAAQKAGFSSAEIMDAMSRGYSRFRGRER